MASAYDTPTLLNLATDVMGKDDRKTRRRIGNGLLQEDDRKKRRRIGNGLLQEDNWAKPLRILDKKGALAREDEVKMMMNLRRWHITTLA
jgi:hypothetical protein